jgi:hypothetical protein
MCVAAADEVLTGVAIRHLATAGGDTFKDIDASSLCGFLGVASSATRRPASSRF